MLFSTKKIFIVFVLIFCADYLIAQSSSSLPSLIDQNKNDGSDDATEAFFRKKMFVKVLTSKNKIFVSEPVMATYKFYVSMSISDQPTVTKQPEFSGCGVKELNFNQGPDFENINNESFAVYTIRKVQLTPLQQGKLSLGKAFVNNFIQVENPDDPYVPKKYNIEVSNTDIGVDVIALPTITSTESANFDGVTGTFNITASVKDKKIPVEENDHLIIIIKGSGNFDAINKPEIEWPANIDHFDGTDSQHVDQTNFPISGDRVFDIPFIGKKEGAFTIQPVKFSFFNPDTKNYQTVQTDSIAVTFTKALTKKDEYNNIVDYDTSNRRYLWIVPAIAVVVALIYFISYKRNKKHAQKAKPVVNITPVPAFVQPQPAYTFKFRTDFSRYLNELEKITDHKNFFTKAKDILIIAVAERIDSNQNSEEILLSALKQRTYNAPVCNKAEALFEAININLYAPYETEADLNFYFTDLKNVVEELQAES